MFDLGWYRVVSIPEITSTLRRPPTLDPRPRRRLDPGMKATLFALFVALLMVGCGELAEKETVEGESKQENHSQVDHSAKPKGDATKAESLLAEKPLAHTP